MPATRTMQNAALSFGYAIALISLILPSVKHGKVMIGLECFVWSIFALLQADLGTLRSLTMSLAGLANLWILSSRVGLLSRTKWLKIMFSIVGYLAFIAAVASPLQVERVYVGYFAWTTSILLISTGLMAEATLGERNVEVMSKREDLR